MFGRSAKSHPGELSQVGGTFAHVQVAGEDESGTCPVTSLTDCVTTTAAAIVTHNPDIARLTENITSIVSQVRKVAIFDNGSANIAEIAELSDQLKSITLLKSSENQGIAAALNGTAQWALAEGFEWLVTLDQDSVASQGMVSELLAVAVDHHAAIVTPYIVDRNKVAAESYLTSSLPRTQRYTQAARRGAITSGALTNIAILFQVGGFDERFFIDYVDYDMNQRVLLAGHVIIRANRTSLLHEVGKAIETGLRIPRKDIAGSWHLETFYSFGHNSSRCYYKARNRVLFTRKYWRHIGLTHEGIWQLPQQIALTMLFEPERRCKFKNFLRGVYDGLTMSLSQEGGQLSSVREVPSGRNPDGSG